MKKFNQFLESEQDQTDPNLINKVEALEKQIRSELDKIRFRSSDYVLEMIIDKYKSGDFYIPKFQRAFVWTDAEQIHFIESILLGVPIPMFFYKEDDEGLIQIIDGSQRIRTIARFMDNQLQLAGMKVLTAANGFYFKDFPVARQKKFKHIAVKGFVIQDVVDDEKTLDIFKRINARDKSLETLLKAL